MHKQRRGRHAPGSLKLKESQHNRSDTFEHCSLQTKDLVRQESNSMTDFSSFRIAGNQRTVPKIADSVRECNRRFEGDPLLGIVRGGRWLKFLLV